MIQTLVAGVLQVNAVANVEVILVLAVKVVVIVVAEILVVEEIVAGVILDAIPGVIQVVVETVAEMILVVIPAVVSSLLVVEDANLVVQTIKHQLLNHKLTVVVDAVEILVEMMVILIAVVIILRIVNLPLLPHVDHLIVILAVSLIVDHQIAIKTRPTVKITTIANHLHVTLVLHQLQLSHQNLDAVLFVNSKKL